MSGKRRVAEQSVSPSLITVAQPARSIPMIRIRLKPSRLLGVTLTVVHLAAAATVFPLDSPVATKVVLIGVIVASLAHALRRHALLRSLRSILDLEVHDREHAAIRDRTRDWRDARILCTSCVTPSLTVLNMKVDGSRLAQHVLLVRDNIDAEDYRKIRVLLRWARPKQDGAADDVAVPF